MKRGSKVNYIQGRDRHQKILFPETLDEYIGEDNPVRFIEAFVEQLDLQKLGFQHSTLNETGRPPYNPADLLKLYIYGYLNRIRSSRNLEKEAGRNLELIWLIGKLQPDFKTIADFRKANLAAIKLVCREFAFLCKKLELFGAELIAIDGSKLKAVNNKRNNYNEKKLKKALEEIVVKIDRYTDELEEWDRKEAELSTPRAEELKSKIKELKERQDKYQQLLERLLKSEQSQISTTDPDSRSMSVGQGVDVCYNVQSVVDEKHKLIVVADVTNEGTDQAQLSVMAKEAKAVLGVEQIEAVADKGYYDGSEVKECEKAGITCYIPKANTSANTKLGLFGKECFKYDGERDCYHCPAGEELTYRYTTFELGREIRYYTTSAGTCRACPLKSQCTRNKKNRRITRWVDEEILERMQQRMASEPEKYRKRKMLVEHPFGTIKRWMDQGYFLMRGIEKVRAEFSLSVLAYNIKRVITILGVPAMVQAVS
jgi:transposase